MAGDGGGKQGVPWKLGKERISWRVLLENECANERRNRKRVWEKSAPARCPTKVTATQAKVSMTSILFYVVCKVVCFYSQVFVL